MAECVTLRGLQEWYYQSSGHLADWIAWHSWCFRWPNTSPSRWTRWISTSRSWRSLPSCQAGLCQSWTLSSLSTNTGGLLFIFLSGWMQFKPGCVSCTRAIIFRATLRKLRAENMFETWVSRVAFITPMKQPVILRFNIIFFFSTNTISRRMTWTVSTLLPLPRRRIQVCVFAVVFFYFLSSCDSQVHNRLALCPQTVTSS